MRQVQSDGLLPVNEWRCKVRYNTYLVTQRFTGPIEHTISSHAAHPVPESSTRCLGQADPMEIGQPYGDVNRDGTSLAIAIMIDRLHDSVRKDRHRCSWQLLPFQRHDRDSLQI